MEDQTSLIKLIRELMPPPPEVILGRVISEDPLEVQGVNDEKLKIFGSTLILSKRFRDTPLALGEEIHILVFNNGKSYYALERR
ncbi:MAG: DUF2577 domain-containing protein [Clostridium sp.]|nr:DUF2577 domain-containing protein [Clostridium sp.]